MKRTTDEIMNTVKSLFGDRNDDEVIAFYEDLTDTLTSTEDTEKIKEEYEIKLEEQDKAWRDKYTERFFSNNGDTNNDTGFSTEDNNSEPVLKTKYEELFK